MEDLEQQRDRLLAQCANWATVNAQLTKDFKAERTAHELTKMQTSAFDTARAMLEKFRDHITRGEPRHTNPFELEKMLDGIINNFPKNLQEPANGKS